MALHNVALNVDKIREKELPVNVYSGSVRTLELAIPWAALASEPVKVKVIGVNLLVGPLTSEQMTVASARQRFVENKGRTLARRTTSTCSSSSPRRKKARRRARR